MIAHDECYLVIASVAKHIPGLTSGVGRRKGARRRHQPPAGSLLYKINSHYVKSVKTLPKRSRIIPKKGYFRREKHNSAFTIPYRCLLPEDGKKILQSCTYIEQHRMGYNDSAQLYVLRQTDIFMIVATVPNYHRSVSLRMGLQSVKGAYELRQRFEYVDTGTIVACAHEMTRTAAHGSA